MTVRTVQRPGSDHSLIIDPDIPGQIGWEALIAMAGVARDVPSGGVVVETGSLFGRSSFVWAMNTSPDTQVFCIDPWVREEWIIEIVEKPQNPELPFSIEAHEHYTRDCPNITRIQGYSPQVVAADWHTPIDLYFDDSDHGQPVLGRNWDFWFDWVKPGGIVCGDEYSPEYPEVMAEIRAISRLWRCTESSEGLFWWLRKPIGAEPARLR